MIHLSRASMLSNVRARPHMLKFGSLRPTGKVTENTRPENHSSYHNSGLPSIQKLMFGSRDSPARALFRQGLGLQRLGLPEKCSQVHTSCIRGVSARDVSIEGAARARCRPRRPNRRPSRHRPPSRPWRDGRRFSISGRGRALAGP